MGKAKSRPYASISLPLPILERIEGLKEELGYWPTKTAFVREACLEKIEKHRKELEARKLEK